MARFPCSWPAAAAAFVTYTTTTSTAPLVEAAKGSVGVNQPSHDTSSPTQPSFDFAISSSDRSNASANLILPNATEIYPISANSESCRAKALDLTTVQYTVYIGKPADDIIRSPLGAPCDVAADLLSPIEQFGDWQCTLDKVGNYKLEFSIYHNRAEEVNGALETVFTQVNGFNCPNDKRRVLTDEVEALPTIETNEAKPNFPILKRHTIKYVKIGAQSCTAKSHIFGAHYALSIGQAYDAELCEKAWADIFAFDPGASWISCEPRDYKQQTSVRFIAGYGLCNEINAVFDRVWTEINGFNCPCY